jgi:hypothetical protein
MRSLRLLLCLAVVVLSVAGCAKNIPPVSSEQKAALRKLLDPKFAMPAEQKGQEDEVYRVLEAFGADRRPDEFVLSVAFTSRTVATVRFTDSGMHGGGTILLKKKGGRWTIEEKLHFL